VGRLAATPDLVCRDTPRRTVIAMNHRMPPTMENRACRYDGQLLTPTTWKTSVAKASSGGSSSIHARGRKSGRASISCASTGSAFRRDSALRDRLPLGLARSCVVGHFWNNQEVNALRSRSSYPAVRGVRFAGSTRTRARSRGRSFRASPRCSRLRAGSAP
jgi:hypothetical protein